MKDHSGSLIALKTGFFLSKYKGYGDIGNSFKLSPT